MNTEHGKRLASLVRSLRSKYQVEPPAERDAVEELVLSFLIWEATETKADAAMRRVCAGVVDFNELRATRPEDIAGWLGKQYPRAEERARRLKASLNEIFIREFAVTLDSCAALNKRDARKYLESLEGMPPYVASRVLLLRMGGHAMPVDEKLLTRLIEMDVVDPTDDEAKAAGILERHVKAEDALATHQLLQAWSDDPDWLPPKKAKSKAEDEDDSARAGRKRPVAAGRGGRGS